MIRATKNFGFVIPDNTKISSDIFVPAERSKGAVSGHKVVCEITDYGKDNRKPEGKITEILGHVNDPGVDIMSIVRGYELPVEFSEKEIIPKSEAIGRLSGEVVAECPPGIQYCFRENLLQKLIFLISQIMM